MHEVRLNRRTCTDPRRLTAPKTDHPTTMPRTEPQAVSLTAKLLPRYKRTITRFVMIPSAGGCFELTVGGKKLYSKREKVEFPDENELVEAVDEAIGA
jgi:selenoprotein W-related protein